MAGVVASLNGRNGIVTLESGDVTTALGYTPYNESNPSAYISASGAPVQSVVGQTGDISASQIASAIGTLVSRNQTVTTSTSTTGVTISAADMIDGNILRSGPTAVFTDTTDTASDLVAAYNASDTAVGSSFTMIIANNSGSTLTLAAGTGVTLSGNTTIPGENSRLYIGIFTNVTSGSEAVTLSGVLSSGT